MKKYICSQGYMKEIYDRYISDDNEHRPKEPLSYKEYIDKNFSYDGNDPEYKHFLNN